MEIPEYPLSNSSNHAAHTEVNADGFYSLAQVFASLASPSSDERPSVCEAQGPHTIPENHGLAAPQELPISIRVPRSEILGDDDRFRLKIFCLVDGLSTSNAFHLTVSSSQTIYDLKTDIKKLKSDTFPSRDADMLMLWLVSIPDDDGDAAIMLNHQIVKKKLHPRTRLSELYPEIVEDDVYVVVERP
ncbi:hypothetical protein EC968_003824 [Mortierella alpina]|nr:hypothetical protein EC968_003824 [Mortierella alpina]